MVKPGFKSTPSNDPSATLPRRSNPRPAEKERHSFMSSSLKDMYQPHSREATKQMDSEDEELDIRKILKDIESLGSSNMSWKEKKKLENQNVLALGGKPPKKQREPIDRAKGAMKKQKHREQKMLKEGLILERFGKRGGGTKMVKRKMGDRVLKPSEGIFRNGVLNVKHLLGSNSSSRDNDNMNRIIKGTKEGKKGNANGKKKGKNHR